MKKTLIIIRPNCCTYCAIESIRFYVSNLPEAISTGDTFSLKIFGEERVSVYHRHWCGSGLILYVQPRDDKATRLFDHLKKQITVEEKTVTLPDQNWEWDKE